MALFQKLIESEAFGPLQPIMDDILREINTCMYTDQICASYAPAIAKMTSIGDKEIHRVPYFLQAGVHTEAVEKAREETHTFKKRALHAEESNRGLQQRCMSLKVA